MKKTTQEPKNLEEKLAFSFGFSTPKVIKTIPLKKHLVKQLEKFVKKHEEIYQKAEDYFKGQEELAILKDKFWTQVKKSVKAKSIEKLKINTKDLTVEFLDS